MGLLSKLNSAEEAATEKQIRCAAEQIRHSGQINGIEIMERCLQAFLAHDYVTCAAHALALIDGMGQASLPLMQMLLISLQHAGASHYFEQLSPIFLDATRGDPWDQSLLHITLGLIEPQVVWAMANDPRQKAAVRYYSGARLLVAGEKELAKKEFNTCPINGPCIEASLALNELVPHIIAKNYGATKDRFMCRPLIAINAS